MSGTFRIVRAKPDDFNIIGTIAVLYGGNYRIKLPLWKGRMPLAAAGLTAPDR